MKIKNVNISRLNFSLLVSTVILVILTVILLILLAGRNSQVQGHTDGTTNGHEATGSEQKNTTPQGTPGESVTYGQNDFTEETTEPVSTLTFNVDDDGDIASRPTYINANISSVTYWDYGDTMCTQFRVVINNVSKSRINNWGMAIEFDKKIELLDCWNVNMELEGENIKVTPISVNQQISTTDEFEFGFIVSCARYAMPKSYKVIIGNNIQQINLNQSGTSANPPVTTTYGQMTTRPQTTTTYDRNTTMPSTGPKETTTREEDTTERTTSEEEKTTPEAMTTGSEETTGDGESTTTSGENTTD